MTVTVTGMVIQTWDKPLLKFLKILQLLLLLFCHSLRVLHLHTQPLQRLQQGCNKAERL